MKTAILISLLAIFSLNASAAQPFSSEFLYDVGAPRSDVYLTVVDNNLDPLSGIYVVFQGYEAFGVYVTDAEGGVYLGDSPAYFESPYAVVNGWVGTYPRGMEFAVFLMDPANPAAVEYRVFSVQECDGCDPAGKTCRAFSYELGTGSPLTGAASSGDGGTGDEVVGEDGAAGDGGVDSVPASEVPIDYSVPMDATIEEIMAADAEAGTCRVYKLMYEGSRSESCSAGEAIACNQYDHGCSPASIDYSGSNSFTQTHTSTFSSSLSAEARTAVAELGISLGSSSSTTVTGKSSVKVDAKLGKKLHGDAANQCGEACIRWQITTLTFRWWWRSCDIETWSKYPWTIKIPVVTGVCIDLSGMHPCP